MALLSQMIRTAAITGRTDTMNAWFADRQSGRWAEQHMAAALPMLPAHPGARPPAETLRQLQDLRARGVINDTELAGLRAQMRV
jgi:hypothetical protein